MKRLVLFLIVCGVSMFLSAQSITLSGKVVDLEKGVPLSNVIVMLKTEDGKAILRHTTTDEKGTFSLEASMMENRMLTFSLMGYESVNLLLQTGKKEYRVSLKPKTIQMKEVIRSILFSARKSCCLLKLRRKIKCDTFAVTVKGYGSMF